MSDDMPHGFVLSDAAIYSFRCQDVYPDIISFAAAIPPHLRPLFLIPIKVETVIASASMRRKADGPTDSGDTPEAELFGTQTVVNYDNEPNLTSKGPGSIYDIDGADERTHHQEYDFDQNVQSPTETSFMEDVDTTNYPYGDYPYRTEETPVRHSSEAVRPVLLLHMAVKPEDLEVRAPEKIRENASSCTVSLTSYDKKTRVYTFAVDCGNGAKTVQASLSEIDHVAMSCNCPFWRWNGPEFHAKANSFMLGQPFGTASPPNVRDPDRKYWMCKHAYSVLRRMDSFVSQVVEENWDKDDEELLDQVDEEWDRLEGAAQIPLDDAEENDVDLEMEPEPGSEESELETPEPEGEPEEGSDGGSPPESVEEEPVQDDDTFDADTFDADKTDEAEEPEEPEKVAEPEEPADEPEVYDYSEAEESEPEAPKSKSKKPEEPEED